MSLDLKSNIHQINLSLVRPPACPEYAFENFRLDAQHLMLYCEGEEVSLTPKQVETLLALVEKKGEIVSKEVLMARLWGNSAVEESNLVQNIHILRKILRETSAGKPMIETLRRRGYRFNGELNSENGKQREPVDIVYLEAPAPTPSGALTLVSEGPVNEQETIVPNSRNKSFSMAIGAAALLAVALVSGFLIYASRPLSSGGIKQFAVLPLRPIDAANRSDLYETGIADALINRLNSIDGFQARPLSAVRNYTQVDQDPLAAGREQKVDYVIDSSYQIADGKIRITSHLVNVATGKIEDPFTFEKSASGVFAIQDAVAVEFGSRLIARFGAASSSLTAWRGTNNEDAYRLYLQGMNLYDKRKLKEASEALESAVQLDPGYARAWAGLAHASRVRASKPGRKDSDQDLRVILESEYQRSMDAIKKALNLDPNVSDAYSAWCEQKTYYEWDFAGAEKMCRKSIDLDPRAPLAHQNYARMLLGRGRFDEAIAEIKTAIDLEPASPFNQRLLGDCLFMARRYPEAEAQYKRLIATDKEFSNVTHWLSMTLELQNKQAEAFEYWIKDLERRKDDQEVIRAFQNAYQTSGWKGFARERLARFEKSERNYFQAAAYSSLIGDSDAAFAYLEHSFENKEWNLTLLEVDPRLDSLRRDNRYADLVRRLHASERV
jgi:adenylate cyclase